MQGTIQSILKQKAEEAERVVLKIKKPRKNEERLRLIDKLSRTLDRTKKGLHFLTLPWSEEMLQDSIDCCLHYQDIKARNWHFNEYNESTKIITNLKEK